MKKVVFVVEYVEHYNVRMYEDLYNRLKGDDIELMVLYCNMGQVKGELNDLDPNIFRKVKCLSWKDRRVVVHQCLERVLTSDLIIIKQGEKYVISYFLLVYKLFLCKQLKLAVWGNCKKEYRLYKKGDIGWKNRFWWKLSGAFNGWFVYNDYVADIVRSTGFDARYIYNVSNSIDVEQEIYLDEMVDDSDMLRVRSELGIPTEAVVCLMCGRLYKERMLSFLFDVLDKVKKRVENFHFIVVGDGDERGGVIRYQNFNSDWFHYVGAQYGKEKVVYFRISKLQLIPGLVGLHVIDSFANNVPIVTTDNQYHSVELEYLKDGYNGVITKVDTDLYAESVIELLQDEKKYDKILKGCSFSKKKYSLSHKTDSFYNGIKDVLMGKEKCCGSQE